MSGERNRGAGRAPLTDDDRSAVGFEVPGVRQGERHQEAGGEARIDIGGLTGDPVEERVRDDSMDPGKGTRCDRRVAYARDRRQVADLGVAEPSPLLAQAGERGKHGGVTVEVVRAHPVQDREQDQPRTSGSRLQDRRLGTAGARTRHGHVQERGQGRGHVLLGHRSRVRARPNERGAVDKEGNPGVVGPRAAVHVLHRRVPRRDDVAFSRHHQDLSGAAREIRAGKPFEEGLSLRRRLRHRRGTRGGRRGRRCSQEQQY